MNVPWGSVDALRSVQIPLEASLVAVTMATSWMLTIAPALVCYVVCVVYVWYGTCGVCGV